MSVFYSPIICGITSFVSGICIAAIFLFKTQIKQKKNSLVSLNWVIGIIIIGVIIAFNVTFFKLFSSNPLDYQKADMLPIIKIMAQRWLNGMPIYEVIPEVWGGMKPIYLPGLWMPFIIPLLLSIDVRWLTIFYVNGAIILLLLLNFKKTNTLNLLFFVSSILLIYCYFINGDRNIFLLTEEGIIYGYYIVLAISIHYRNFAFIGISLALCLCSRYLILGFAFSFFLFSFLNILNRENRVLVASFILTCILLLFVSHSIFEIENFIKLPGVYLNSVISDIKRYEGNIKEVRYSFAYLFYPSKIKLFYSISIILSFTTPICLFIINSIRPFKNQTYFLFGCIKMSMVIFFSFLIIPFHYLTFTSAFFSLSIIYLSSIESRDVVSGLELNYRSK